MSLRLMPVLASVALAVVLSAAPAISDTRTPLPVDRASQLSRVIQEAQPASRRRPLSIAENCWGDRAFACWNYHHHCTADGYRRNGHSRVHDEGCLTWKHICECKP